MGFKHSVKKHVEKGTMVHTSRCNLEVEPFVAQWIIQMKENMHKLGAIKNHMPPRGVAKKGRTYIDSC